METPTPTAKLPAWLESAVFYEIYPQTFSDSNGDGIGDLPGITARLDYIASLGVTAIWLNPCWESPFQDAGYDVSDFRKVAPRYGTNDDLVDLFQAAHRRGMRVLLDLVPGHTSTEHDWFKQSQRHQPNPYSDYFIWTPSVWHPGAMGLNPVRGTAERDAGYIPNFFAFQPALNYGFALPDPAQPWQQPVSAPGPQAVRGEMRAVIKFWLDLGADGFRVDMAHSLVKQDYGWHATTAFWQETRAWLDAEYPQAALVSEWGVPGAAIPAGFHLDFLLHFNGRAYSSLFRKHSSFPPDPYGASFFDRSGRGNIREFLDEYLPAYEATRALGYIALISGNHDIPQRMASQRTVEELEVVYTFLLTMPGVPFIYYGDEIGMRTIEGLASKEGGYGRTGARTPMQWDSSANLGFSSAPADSLYLPVDSQPGDRTVAAQQADPTSLLNRIRQLIALRKDHPALANGAAFELVYGESGKNPLVFKRAGGGETLLVAVNPSDAPVSIPLADGVVSGAAFTLHGCDGAITQAANGWVLSLPGISAGVYRV